MLVRFLCLFSSLPSYRARYYHYVPAFVSSVGSFTVEARLTAETYEQMSFEVASEAQEVIKDLSNTFWRCDPAKHEEGKTFEQVTELLQGYMENEVDLNRDGTCNNNCAYYQHAKREGCYMVGNVANQTEEEQASRPRGGTRRRHGTRT